jgi:hypothetical protein
MTIDGKNPTQQRQQSLTLSDALSSLFAGDLGVPVRMPSSRRDPIAQRAFLRSVLASALDILADNDDDRFLKGDWSSDDADQEDIGIQNQTR